MQRMPQAASWAPMHACLGERLELGPRVGRQTLEEMSGASVRQLREFEAGGDVGVAGEEPRAAAHLGEHHGIARVKLRIQRIRVRIKPRIKQGCEHARFERVPPLSLWSVCHQL